MSAKLGVLAPTAGTKEGAGTHAGVHPGVPLTLGGLQDVHHLPDLQREVMLLGAREVPHGCGERGREMGSLPGAPHQSPGPVHLHPTASPPQHPNRPRSAPRGGADSQPHKQHETPKNPNPTPQKSHGTACTGLGAQQKPPATSPALRGLLWDPPACHPRPGCRWSCSWHKQCREASAS